MCGGWQNIERTSGQTKNTQTCTLHTHRVSTLLFAPLSQRQCTMTFPMSKDIFEILKSWNSFLFIFSSVRSSNSHPDLLVTHHHQPLFQITPVLNTGLSLSEPLQLYIKAIMLYKGNHWTRCAGFMDASWVRLGITTDDLGTSWALPGDNMGMTWGRLGHYFCKTWQDSGILWHTLAYSGKLWHTLAHSDIFWHILAYSGIL